jgi:hypothetical protein
VEKAPEAWEVPECSQDEPSHCLAGLAPEMAAEAGRLPAPSATWYCLSVAMATRICAQEEGMKDPAQEGSGGVPGPLTGGDTPGR